MRDENSTQSAGHLPAAIYFLVATTTGLIVLGALVRAHEAGLACPDWPLCFGEVIPEMDLKIAFEWSHRALAGSVSLVFAGILWFCWRKPELWRRTRIPLCFAAVLLAVQIILGALTVWQLLAAWTVTAHLLTGNAFNVALSLAAHRSRAPRPHPVAAPRAARTIGAVAVALLVLQVALGGLVSSTFAGLACPEWPACSGGEFLPSFEGSVGLHLAHRWNPVLLVAALALAAIFSRGTAGGRWWLGALCLALLQWGVGIANVAFALAVEVTALHSGIAALLILCEARALHDSFYRES